MNQGSPEWLKWRKQGIGASDVPAIMGTSKYSSAFKLWMQKTGQAPDMVSNPAMERGHQLEPIARFKACLEIGDSFEPALAEYKEWPVLRCSFDGVSLDGQEVMEIKYMGVEAFEAARSGVVQEQHYDQMQTQMLIQGASQCRYVAINNSEEITIKLVYADPDRQAAILDACKKFWVSVQTGCSPSSDEAIVNDTILEAKLNEYFYIKAQADALAEQMDNLKKEIEDMSTHERTHCGSYLVAWVERKGAINYKNIPELKGVELERYRAKPSRYVKISEVKK